LFRPERAAPDPTALTDEHLLDDVVVVVVV
jgi:hypothetical protein